MVEVPAAEAVAIMGEKLGVIPRKYSALRETLLRVLDSEDKVLWDEAWFVWCQFLQSEFFSLREYQSIWLASSLGLGEKPVTNEAVWGLGQAVLRHRELRHFLLHQMENTVEWPTGEPIGLARLLGNAAASGDGKRYGLALACCEYLKQIQACETFLATGLENLVRGLGEGASWALDMAVVVFSHLNMKVYKELDLPAAFNHGFETWQSQFQSQDKAQAQQQFIAVMLESALRLTAATQIAALKIGSQLPGSDVSRRRLLLKVFEARVYDKETLAQLIKENWFKNLVEIELQGQDIELQAAILRHYHPLKKYSGYRELLSMGIRQLACNLQSAAPEAVKKALLGFYQVGYQEEFLPIDLVPIFETLLNQEQTAREVSQPPSATSQELFVSRMQILCQEMPQFTPAISIALLNIGHTKLFDGETLAPRVVQGLATVLGDYYPSLDWLYHREARFLQVRGVTGTYSRGEALLAKMFSSSHLQEQEVAFAMCQCLPASDRRCELLSKGLETLMKIVTGWNSDENMKNETRASLARIMKYCLVGDWECQVVGLRLWSLLSKDADGSQKEMYDRNDPKSFFFRDKELKNLSVDTSSLLPASIGEALVGRFIVAGVKDLNRDNLNSEADRTHVAELLRYYSYHMRGWSVYMAYRVADSLGIDLNLKWPFGEREIREIPNLPRLRKLYQVLVAEIQGESILQKILHLLDLLASSDQMHQGLSSIDAYLLLEGVFLVNSDIPNKIQGLLTNRSLRTALWNFWLTALDNYAYDKQEQLYVFMENSCLAIPGSLAGLLQDIKQRPELQQKHGALLDRLMSSKGLERLLMEYQEATDDNATPSGLTIQAYGELIQWLLGQMSCSVVIEPAGQGSETCGTISWYEDSMTKKLVSLTQDKLKRLYPSGSKGYGMFKVPAERLSPKLERLDRMMAEIPADPKTSELDSSDESYDNEEMVDETHPSFQSFPRCSLL